MKLISKISTIVCLLFIANLAYATTGEKKKSDDKSEQQQGDKKQTPEDIELIENPELTDQLAQQEVDSTEDTSVSKYNFIFYFLYKLKYNEDQKVDAIF